MIHHPTIEEAHPQPVAAEPFRLSESQWTPARNALVFAALIGWLVVIVGVIFNRAQLHASYLTAFTFTVAIFWGGMFFLQVQHLTGSAWSVTVRRLEESLLSAMPLLGLMFIPVLLGLHHLYEWTHHDVVANDPVLTSKAGYLNERFFIARAMFFFAIWSLWCWKLFRNSTKQDAALDAMTSIKYMDRLSRWSAPGLIILMLSATLASFDWLMSLDPHWYSTIFGLYIMAGGGQAFWAAMIVICVLLRRANILVREINEEHYHDLGKWLFALTVFWAYIGFSQYMLIWYANLPEETEYFRHRFEGTWAWWSTLLLFGRFIIPFLVLLPRSTKRNLRVLVPMAVFVLLMHFVDHLWVIGPVFSPQGVKLHWMHAASFLAILATVAVAFWARLRKNYLVPVGDPRFEQGLHFHNQ